jgi:DNA-binding response OmpR family regulator
MHDQEIAEGGPLPQGAGTIFVVEDDVLNGQLLVEVLMQESGHHALLLPDGFLALKLARFIQPILFIIDYYLPRMNGLVLYDRLHARKELKDVPAIIISAALEGHEDEIKQRGLVALSKPFDLGVFLAVVERLLKRENR